MVAMGIVRHTTIHTSDSDNVDRDWIDLQGRFIFGKYEGDLVENVASDDPSYVRWIINEVENISDVDRALLANHLRYSGNY